jgi:hypothetical protein
MSKHSDFSEGMKMGAGLRPGDEEDSQKTGKLLDKANSLLDEVSREERAGFKAEIKKDLPSL